MTITKRTMHLTDDNWADYFPADYAASLVEGLTLTEDGIDPDEAIVIKLLAWLARESGRSPEVRYEMSRPAAATLLQAVAGWPECVENPTGD